MSLVTFEYEIEDEDATKYLLLLIEAEVEPGFRGSHSYNAPSDIDYYGQPTQFDGVIDMKVYDESLPDNGGQKWQKYRKPTEEEQKRIDAHMATNGKSIGEAALKAYEDKCEADADADVDHRIDEERDREFDDDRYDRYAGHDDDY